MGKPTNKTNSIIMTTFWSSHGVDRFDFQTLILENVVLLVSVCLPFPKGKAISLLLLLLLFFPRQLAYCLIHVSHGRGHENHRDFSLLMLGVISP